MTHATHHDGGWQASSSLGEHLTRWPARSATFIGRERRE